MMLRFSWIVSILVTLESCQISAFMPTIQSSMGKYVVNNLSNKYDNPNGITKQSSLCMSSRTNNNNNNDNGENNQDDSKATMTAKLCIPLSFDEMVNQVSSAMEDAYQQGLNRQIIRVLLPRSANNDQLLQYYENDAQDNVMETVLVPTDETWQGGIMQLYRAASYTCQAVLRRYSRNLGGGVVPRLQEDRSVDESGVDGIGLWLTQGSTPQDDVSCFVQPSQETIDAIESISKQAGKRLVTLLNPQWRIADDALDSVSRNDSLFGNLAAFLGGKGGSIRRLDAMGFENTYTVEGYVCRGGNIRLIKRFDSDWAVFAENDAATDYILVGTSSTRPTYQDVDAMLENKGISLKYARDIGLAPKL